MRPSFKHIRNKYPSGNIIGAEVGVDEGINAEDILKELKISKLSLIDPFIQYMDWKNPVMLEDKYKALLVKFCNTKNVEIIRKTSIEASSMFDNESLDFVYLDGDHSYESAKSDMECWWPKVKLSGVLCGHDFQEDGIRKALAEFLMKYHMKLCVVDDGELPDWWIDKHEWSYYGKK